MSAIENARIRAATVLKVLSSGRTKPCLIQGVDSQGNLHEVVIKWQAGMELKTVNLICELISSLLADDLDLLRAEPFIVEVEDEFAKSIATPEIATLAQASIGLNFGSRYLGPGVTTWPKDKPIPVPLRPLAAEIFAFDVLIQNPDRRQSNPNLLWTDEQLFAYDHEQAFSFLAGVIGWKPPWTGEGLGFYRDHVFYDRLRGLQLDWDRFKGALAALTDARLNEYVAAVPIEWQANNDAAHQITEYLRQARDNGAALLAVISRFLQ